VLTIGFTMGPNGHAMPEIDWPQIIETDDLLVQIVSHIRKAGIKATTHITKSPTMEDRLEIRTPYTVAKYRRALYQPPPKLIFWTTSNSKPEVPDFETHEVWVFMGTEYVGPTPAAPSEMYFLNTPTWGEIGPPATQAEDYARLASQLSRHIPDIRKTVKAPCNCRNLKTGQIWYLIQHLNDHHHPKHKRRETWTRERIADWLDEVDADLTFDPDLPAKRAARRKAAQEERRILMQQQIDAGLMSSADMLKSLGVNLASMEPKVDDLQKAVVKLDVAIDEFATSMHESMKNITNCTCPACATKEES